jgi:hypothetical protein
MAMPIGPYGLPVALALRSVSPGSASCAKQAELRKAVDKPLLVPMLSLVRLANGRSLPTKPATLSEPFTTAIHLLARIPTLSVLASAALARPTVAMPMQNS